jgi:hypothetical protein
VLPIGEHTIQEFVEGGPVVWLGDVAQFVGNDVVNGIDWCLDQATIEEQTRRTGKVMNDHRADWREARAFFPGDVPYVWHGALHTSTVADKGGTALHATVTANADDFARDLAPLIADIRAAGHTSLRAIAAELTRGGIKTRRGGTWGVGNMKGLLERTDRPG